MERVGESANGRMGEWENGRMGEWGSGRIGDSENHSSTLPLYDSPSLPLSALSLHHFRPLLPP